MSETINPPSKDFPGQIHETAGGGIVLSKLDEVINWAALEFFVAAHLCHQLLRH